MFLLIISWTTFLTGSFSCYLIQLACTWVSCQQKIVKPFNTTKEHIKICIMLCHYRGSKGSIHLYGAACQLPHTHIGMPPESNPSLFFFFFFLMDGWAANELEEGKVCLSHFLPTCTRYFRSKKETRNNKIFVHWLYVINTGKFPDNAIAIMRNFRIGLPVDTGSWVQQFVILSPTNKTFDING